MQEEQVKEARPDEQKAEEPFGEGMHSSESLEKLKELVEFLKSTGVAEFDFERSNFKLRLKFQGAYAPMAASAAPAADLAQLFASAPHAAAVAASAPVVHASSAAETKEDDRLHIVKSPLVGTLYESSSPGAAPFVKVGDVVEVGQILCIVEAMKLMNEVEADAAGEIVARIVANGQPVEYGQPLFEIRPR